MGSVLDQLSCTTVLLSVIGEFESQVYKGDPRTCAILILVWGSNWGIRVFPIIKITVVHQVRMSILIKSWGMRMRWEHLTLNNEHYLRWITAVNALIYL